MQTQKWQYLRDEVHSMRELDEKLGHWGNLGWELVEILHERHVEMVRKGGGPGEMSRTDTWNLILKQPGV
jgi:hypothetical protein